MKNWPVFLWILFIALVTFILTVFSYLYLVYFSIGFFLVYVGVFAMILLYFYIFSKIYSNCHLHFHHYIIGISVVIMACYQNHFITILHAVFNGIWLEGASRWGFDPIWIPDTSATPLSTKKT
jgi:hypothetical protein